MASYAQLIIDEDFKRVFVKISLNTQLNGLIQVVHFAVSSPVKFFVIIVVNVLQINFFWLSLFLKSYYTFPVYFVEIQKHSLKSGQSSILIKFSSIMHIWRKPEDNDFFIGEISILSFFAEVECWLERNIVLNSWWRKR